MTYRIEGYPVIIRFKTLLDFALIYLSQLLSIEGYPVIIRFKTSI